MKRKELVPIKYRGTKCLNCGTHLDILDKFCHQCGQPNSIKKLSLNDFIKEFFANTFAYDSRLALTIKALLFSPGKITKEYIAGKRKKYVNPFRFYLSVSIIFFLINSFLIDFDDIHNSSTQKTKNTASTEENSSAPTIINALGYEEKDDILYTEQQLDTMGIWTGTLKRFSTYENHYKTTQETNSKKALKKLNHIENSYNKYLYKRVLKIGKLIKNPSDFLEFLFNNLTLIIFFFLPFFALGLWALYFRRSFSYIEHMIFTFHMQTTFFIMTGIGIVLKMILKLDFLIFFSVILPLFYIYFGMLNFYNQGIRKTIIKFALVNIIFFTLAMNTSVIVLGISILIF